MSSHEPTYCSTRTQPLYPHSCTHHSPAGISSPTCLVLGSLQVIKPPHTLLLANTCSLSALTHLTPANTDFPVVCSFSGQREDLGPGGGRGEPAALGKEHPAQAWPGEGGEWGDKPERKASPNPARSSWAAGAFIIPLL